MINPVSRTDPSVPLTLINNQAHSGVFNVELPVLADDDVGKLKRRLARSERAVKDASRIKIYR